MIGSSENRISYNGNGIATEFAYTFKILEKSDMKVLHVAADGTETLLVSDYYVDMEKNVVLYPGYAPGAEIPEQNRPPILPEGERLVLYREVPITQESALDKHWPFNVIENGLDKLTIICQQIWDRLQRSFYVSESTSTNFDPKVPIEAGKTFRVKDDGTGFEVTEDPGKVIDGATALLKQTTEQAESANEAATNAQNAATLAEVQANSVKKYKALWFDSVAAMKAEPSLTAGAYVCTAGYYTPNDGGCLTYLVRAKADADVEKANYTHLLQNGLVAEAIYNNLKKFKPKVYFTPEMFYCFTDDYYQNTVAKKLQMGCLMGTYGPVVMVSINYSDSGMTTTEDLNYVKRMIADCKTMGTPCNTLKIHYLGGLNTDDLRTQYKNKCLSIIQELDCLNNGITRVTVLNERPDVYTLLPTESKRDIYNAFTLDLINTIKSLGYEVGITFAGLEYGVIRTINYNPVITDALDFFGGNIYGVNSYAKELTTFEDSLGYWDSAFSGAVYSIKQKYPNKKVILSEFGIYKYWESLQNASDWKIGNDGKATDAMGKNIPIYFHGLFNGAEAQLFDEVWLFYTDFYYNYPKIPIYFREYLLGKEM